MNMPNRIAAIQERLSAATPGPWAVEGDKGFGHKVYQPGGWATLYVCGELHQGHDDGLNDATFIAAAPSDVAYLLDLARRQAAQIDAITKTAASATNVHGRLALRDEIMNVLMEIGESPEVAA